MLNALRAIAEPTRLNIVAVLAGRELNVTELTQVLAQSQPRVSRHLKLLCEAGVLERHPEGASAFFGLARRGAGAAVVRQLLPLIDWRQPELARIAERLAELRAARSRAATAYFRQVAPVWDELRDLVVGDAEVEQRLLELVGDASIHDLLDLGTGTGRMLEVFAPRIEHGLGIDLSADMLRVARAKLDRPEFAHCALRRGDLYALELPEGSADVAVLHHVLHFLDDPALAIREAARTLRPGGRLLVADFTSHEHERLRSELHHRRLGFRDEEVSGWCEAAGLTDVRVDHLAPYAAQADGRLVVALWRATQHADAPSHHYLEVA